MHENIRAVNKILRIWALGNAQYELSKSLLKTIAFMHDSIRIRDSFHARCRMSRKISVWLLLKHSSVSGSYRAII